MRVPLTPFNQRYNTLRASGRHPAFFEACRWPRPNHQLDCGLARWIGIRRYRHKTDQPVEGNLTVEMELGFFDTILNTNRTVTWKNGALDQHITITLMPLEAHASESSPPFNLLAIAALIAAGIAIGVGLKERLLAMTVFSTIDHSRRQASAGSYSEKKWVVGRGKRMHHKRVLHEAASCK